MRKTLIIADNDEIFVKILEEYIFRNHGDEFEIRTYTSKEYLEKFFSTPRKVDILLLNPKFEFKGMKEQYINNIVFISNDEESYNLEYDSIFRFGELNVICDKLKNINIKNDDEVELKASKFISEKSKVTTVYSPIGGVGKSTIAVSIAVDLSLKGNSVLYLNLENMSSINAYFKPRKTTSNLSHIIEQLSFGGSQLNQYINESIIKDGETNVNYINPADNIFAIEQVTSDDIKYLINTLKELKRFNHIIIDTSSTYDTVKKAIIDASDKIIMPLEQNIIGKQKVINFLNCIDETELHNFVPVINKYREEIENNIKDITITNNSFHIQGIINYYEPLLESDSYIKIFNRHNPFTASIKSLTNY